MGFLYALVKSYTDQVLIHTAFVIRELAWISVPFQPEFGVMKRLCSCTFGNKLQVYVALNILSSYFVAIQHGWVAMVILASSLWIFRVLLEYSEAAVPA